MAMLEHLDVLWIDSSFTDGIAIPRGIRSGVEYYIILTRICVCCKIRMCHFCVTRFPKSLILLALGRTRSHDF